MDILVSCQRNGIKLRSKHAVGRESGEKNLFFCFRNGFQDVQMDSLCATQRKSVEEKEKP